MWILLQPRGVIGATFLYATLFFGVAGTLVVIALYALLRQRYPAMALQASGGIRDIGDLQQLQRLGDLPADRLRPAVFSFRGDQLRFDLPQDLLQRLRALCDEHDVVIEPPSDPVCKGWRVATTLPPLCPR